MPIVSYPYDPTGVATTNRVVREPHVLSEINSNSKRTLVPFFAPFYQNNFVLEYKDMNGNYSPLTLGIDYDLGLKYVGASVALAKPIYGGAIVNTEFTQGMIYLTYNTLGGTWVGNRSVILEHLAGLVHNPRIGTWDQITDVQAVFPPLPHGQDLMQFRGLEGLIESVGAVERALSEPKPISLWTQQQLLVLGTEQASIRTRLNALETAVHNLQNPA